MQESASAEPAGLARRSRALRRALLPNSEALTGLRLHPPPLQGEVAWPGCAGIGGPGRPCSRAIFGGSQQVGRIFRDHLLGDQYYQMHAMRECQAIPVGLAGKSDHLTKLSLRASAEKRHGFVEVIDKSLAECQI
jgi:hypothetical protein